MAYVADIPKPTDVKSQSQPLIRGNFNALVPFSESYADLPRISSPVITGTDLGIYNALFATTAQSELFVNRASGTEVPFTAKGVGSTAASGWCYLPSGILLKWGTYAFTGALPGGAAIKTIDVGTISGGPNYTTVFQTLVTPYWGGPTSDTASIPLLTASGTTLAGNFTAFATNYTNVNRANLKYLVIGV